MQVAIDEDARHIEAAEVEEQMIEEEAEGVGAIGENEEDSYSDSGHESQETPVTPLHGSEATSKGRDEGGGAHQRSSQVRA